jgi:cell wall-associated NlpC family hydrolase
VRAAQAAAEDDAHRADEARQSAADAEGQLNSLLGQVQGQLADLVQQEAQRQAAAEAAAAQAAAAQADAARQPAATEASAGDTLGAAFSASDDSASTARAPLVAVGASAYASAALQAAYSQLGVPYVYGGASPDEGFDCSGLMMWAYGQAGVSLPHPADYQRDDIQPISESQLQPGDLVFYGEPPSHVAMYAGGGQIINAPYTGEVVRMQDMYYSSKPMTFGRVN